MSARRMVCWVLWITLCACLLGCGRQVTIMAVGSITRIPFAVTLDEDVIGQTVSRRNLNAFLRRAERKFTLRYPQWRVDYACYFSADGSKADVIARRFQRVRGPAESRGVIIEKVWDLTGKWKEPMRVRGLFSSGKRMTWEALRQQEQEALRYAQESGMDLLVEFERISGEKKPIDYVIVFLGPHTPQ